MNEEIELANLDQALMAILHECDVDDETPNILLAMRRAYRLSESKEMLVKMMGEPPLRGLKEEEYQDWAAELCNNPPEVAELLKERDALKARVDGSGWLP